SQRSSAPLDELLALPLVTQGEAAPARLTDYVPAAAPIVVDVPRVLDATREDAPASPPLRERLAGRQLVELSLVAGTSSAPAGSSIAALGVIVLTEAEIFGARRRLLRRPKYQRGAALTAFTDLAIGDVVVHEDHGLGRYLGLKTMTVGDRDGDFLVLEYAEG